MTKTAELDDSLRQAILAKPDALLDDQRVMNALVSANERSMGSNIVDLRGIAMERMEARLDRLEDTHRSVIAAAYENLAGTNQIHRAVLRLLDPMDFESYLANLGGELAEILRVDSVTLVLETANAEQDAGLQRLDQVLKIVEPGFVAQHLQSQTGYDRPDRSDRQVTLRQLHSGAARIHGEKADFIRSEACLRLDLGEGRLPSLLVLGSEDPHQFTPQHGTDLLAFFAGVFERSMRHWLS
ncbi:DUF484 family protein [Phaeobacter sp.]|uniref:DUF484 family protein n=1 Tax=Phaeobacter sp. TaxID=1902409 RepID=UPI0025E7E616|nr:DUF484 family protein [Phaeobacter sp.]